MHKHNIDREALSRAIYLIVLFVLINIFALAVKPSPYRRLLFLPLLCISIYLVFSPTGYPTIDYCIGGAVFPYLFAASDYILLTDVQRELQLVKPPQRAHRPIEHASLLHRIDWATKLFGSQRGLGWAHKPHYAMPPRPATSIPRRAFVKTQLTHAAAAALLGEAVNFYNSTCNPAMYAGGPSLAAPGWFWRYQAVWAWGVPMIALPVANHALSAALSVAIGATGPEDWPPFIGSIALAFSVRNFWGRVWHQSMRRFLSAHGKFVAHRVLRLRRGSVASAYTQLYVAFFISAMMHYLPEYMALRHWGGGGMCFFMLQPVGITIEECVQAAGRRLGFAASAKWKLLGHFWVWSWLAFCLPIWQDPLLHAGVFEEIRYSIVAWMLRRNSAYVLSDLFKHSQCYLFC